MRFGIADAMVQSDFGTFVSQGGPFIPFFPISNEYRGNARVRSWSLGWHSAAPVVLKNETGREVQLPGPGGKTLTWPPDALTVQSGPRNEKPAVRMRVKTDGLYLLVAAFTAIEPLDRGMEVGVAVNGEPLWISASPDRFVGQIRLRLDDTLELFAGVLSGYSYVDSAVRFNYALFLLDPNDPGHMKRVDDNVSALSDDATRQILSDSRAIAQYEPRSPLKLGNAYRHGVWKSLAGPILSKHFVAGYGACQIDEVLNEIDVPQRHQPSLKYLILFTPRSGSTFLSECLGRTRKLGFPTEYLSEHTYLTSASMQRNQTSSTWDFLLSAFSSDNGVFGMEIDRDRLLLPAQPPIPDLENWKIIYHTRQNRLAQAISYYRATAFNMWSVYHDRTDSPYFSRKEIIRSLCYLVAQEEAFEQFFTQRGVQPLRSTYEQFTADIPGSIQRIATFLGLDKVGADDVIHHPSSVSRLADEEATSWALQIVSTGGDYKGYVITPAGDGFRAMLAHAEVSGLTDPTRYPPLAFDAPTLEAARQQIDRIVDGFAAMIASSDRRRNANPQVQMIRKAEVEPDPVLERRQFSDAMARIDVAGREGRDEDRFVLALHLLVRFPRQSDSYRLLAETIKSVARDRLSTLVAEAAKALLFDNPWPWETTAQLAFEQKDFEQAFSDSTYLIEHFPALSNPYFIGCVAARLSGRLDDAVGVAEMAARQFPDLLWPVLELGWIAVTRGDTAGAFIVLDELRRRFYHETTVKGYEITVLRTAGRLDDALASALALLPSVPDQPWIHQEVNLILRLANRLDEAKVRAHDACRLFPTDEWPNSMLAATLAADAGAD